jgi:hypothetical protein
MNHAFQEAREQRGIVERDHIERKFEYVPPREPGTHPSLLPPDTAEIQAMDPRDRPEEDPAFTTHGRLQLRAERDKAQLAGEVAPMPEPPHEPAPDHLFAKHDPQRIVARAWRRVSGKDAREENERILRQDPHHPEYVTGEHLLNNQIPPHPEPTDKDWTPDDAPEPVAHSEILNHPHPSGRAKNVEYPASHSGRPSKFSELARNSAVRLVAEPHTVTTTTLAIILLHIGAVLTTALAIYGLTGLFYAMNSGSDWARDLVYVIAPAAIALSFVISSFALARAKDESAY